MTATLQGAAPAVVAHGRTRMLHRVIMMLAIIVAAVAMTYLIGSGEFERKGTLVVPGTYHAIEGHRPRQPAGTRAEEHSGAHLPGERDVDLRGDPGGHGQAGAADLHGHVHRRHV